MDKLMQKEHYKNCVVITRGTLQTLLLVVLPYLVEI